MATRGSGDDDGASETATANEEFIDLIQQWQKDNINRDIKVVVAGRSGAGKSTLINNFLTLDKNEAAKTGLQPTSVTEDVKEYKGEVNGIPIRAIDMPGLRALDHNEEKLAEIVATLTHLTGGKADILIYCVRLDDRLSVVDEWNIRTLNEAFGEMIWKNAVIALTHADSTLDEQEVGATNHDLLTSFTKEIRAILENHGVFAHITLHYAYAAANNVALRPDPAPIAPSSLGTSVDPIIPIAGILTGKTPNKPLKWRQSLLSQIINIDLRKISSMVMQLNGVCWSEVRQLLEQETQDARFKARAHELGFDVGYGLGTIIGGLLGLAFIIVSEGTAVVAVGPGMVPLGTAAGVLGGHSVAALCILAREMKCQQNQALAKEITFYIKVNKKLKELRDGLQE